MDRHDAHELRAIDVQEVNEGAGVAGQRTAGGGRDLLSLPQLVVEFPLLVRESVC